MRDTPRVIMMKIMILMIMIQRIMLQLMSAITKELIMTLDKLVCIRILMKFPTSGITASLEM